MPPQLEVITRRSFFMAFQRRVAPCPTHLVIEMQKQVHDSPRPYILLCDAECYVRNKYYHFATQVVETSSIAKMADKSIHQSNVVAYGISKKDDPSAYMSREGDKEADARKPSSTPS
ncbi:hypothetical protein ACOSQ4_012178 [Xanthoceras sorbifolium]